MIKSKIYDKITQAGVKLFFPFHKTPGAYPGAYWNDAKGNFMASITAHEFTNDGKTIHNHLTFKTARKDRAKNLDRSRVHITFGHDIAQMQVTEYADLVVYSKAIIRGEDKKFYQITVDKTGNLKAIPVPHSYIQFTEEA